MSALLCNYVTFAGTPAFVMMIQGAEQKRVFGCTLDRARNLCFFPAYYPFCADVARDLKIVYPDLEFTEAAQRQIDTCQMIAQGGPSVFVPPPGFQFVTDPYEHQLEGLTFALRNLRCGLFFDMGTGKTKIVVDLLRVLKQRTLVLSPIVGIEMWLSEIARHSGGDLTATALTGQGEAGKKAAKEITIKRRELKKQVDAAQNETAKHLLQKQLDDMHGPGKAAKLADIQAAAGSDVIIVSYDTAKLYQEDILTELDYKIIVADESHNLRGPTTDRTKAALGLASKAARRIILTGTPSLGNPMHLYGQLAFLAKYIPAKDQWTFRRHYIVYAKGERTMVLGYKNLGILHDKVARVSIRKRKEECLDLPLRTIIDLHFELSKEQRQIYNDIVDGTIVELADGTLYEPTHAAVALQKLLQVLSGFIIKPPPPVCDGCENLLVCAPAKIKPYTKACEHYPEAPEREILHTKENPKLYGLEELLDGILAEDRNKVIVWCYFIEELNIVEELLVSKKLGYIRVDGSNSSHGQKLSEVFNTDPAKRVWLAQVGTGVALTLNAAAYMVYFGLTFRLDDYLQSMDRNHRIGQKEPTFVYRLIAKRSAAEFVAVALAAKLDLAETLTSRIDCLLCDKSNECLPKGRKPFEHGCIYPSRVSRKVIRPSAL